MVEQALMEGWNEVAREACAMLGVEDPPWRLRVRGDEAHAKLRLVGRSRTLAIRRFAWTFDARTIATRSRAGVASLESMKFDEGAIHMLLRPIANAQALRESMARLNGFARVSLPIERLRIDRSMATIFVARHGADALRAIAAEARLVDAHEIRPCESTTTMASHGPHAFGVSTCEVDVATMTVRMPEIRLSPRKVGHGTYSNDSLQIEGASLPDAALSAAAGRPLGAVVETSEPALRDRVVERAFNYTQGVVIRLVEDPIDVGEAI